MAKKKKKQSAKTKSKANTRAAVVKDLVAAVQADLCRDKSRGKKYKVATLGDLPPCGVTEWINTGSVMINGVIKRPGIPVGQLTVITGRAASGKTTLVAHLLKGVQDMGGVGMLIDAETKFFGTSRAARIGVDGSRVLYIPGPITLEKVFAIIIHTAKASVKNKAPSVLLIVVDSHSAAPTMSDLVAVEKQKPGQPGIAARVTSFYLKTVMSLLQAARIALVFVCQPRSKIGSRGFGPTPETFIAERPITHHAVLVLRMIMIGKLYKKSDRSDPPYGIEVKVVCTKSNIGPPYHDCVVHCRNDRGLDDTLPLLNLAHKHDLVRQIEKGYYHLTSDRKDKKFRRSTWGRVLEMNPPLLKQLSLISSKIPQDGDVEDDDKD